MTSNQPQIDGWRFYERHHSAFVRSIEATPIKTVEVEYHTPTMIAGRPADASYLAHVISVTIDHRWDEKKQAWWSTGGLRLILINPRTGKQYKNVQDWKSSVIYPSRADEGVRNAAAITEPLIEATKPNTIVTVIETEQDAA